MSLTRTIQISHSDRLKYSGFGSASGTHPLPNSSSLHATQVSSHNTSGSKSPQKSPNHMTPLQLPSPALNVHTSEYFKNSPIVIRKMSELEL